MAETASSPVAAAVLGFLTAVQGVPDRLYESSLDMATTFRDKINKYADLVSGKNNDHTKDEEHVMLENKKTLDNLWRKHRRVYDALLKLSRKNTTVLNDYELALLRALVASKRRP
jgi:hypothetical protein